MSQLRLGYLFGFGAYVLWGFFPAYFKLLIPSSALEILAHRILWSLAFMVVVLTFMRRWRNIKQLTGQPARLAGISVAAVLIGVNWATYIYAVNIGQIIETALGYFINPLVVIVLGVIFFAERLRPVQWAAVGLGTVAVIVLTVDYGRPPWIALILAITFGLYGFSKKRLGLPPADGLLLESAALALPAAITLGFLTTAGKTTFGEVSTGHTLLLMAAGAITAVPLLLFAGAANRIPMTAIGMLQYVGPTIQLIIGVFVFHEPMPPVRLAGFCLVWLALIVFSWDAIANARRSSRLALAVTSAASVR